MPKKKSDDAATLERFERALRNALSTPAEPHKPLRKKRAKKARRKH